MAARKLIKVELEKGEEKYWCACGHDHLNKFNQKDICSWKKEMAEWTGIRFTGLS
ncbi:MAG: hypothetical protein AAF696_03795 [Bacteroidota bacterium]